jgi:N6-L-threonylcarbamoyladenine synthase
VIDGPVLAIETSCDETAAAVVDGRAIRSSIVASQAELHSPYGGVVPEVAARHHLGTVNGVVESALSDADCTLDDITAIAVTQRPGLIGALLIGVATAKALAYAARKPLVMVDHLAGHIWASWLEPVCLDPPFVSLVASGGHTRLDMVHADGRIELLGQTIDDAAGEALDKGARMLGLGYPGGPALERLARTGDRTAHRFPIALEGRAGYDFSFAGVKTSLLYALRDANGDLDETRRGDLAASYQEAVVRPLADRLVAVAVARGVSAVALGGGVAANGRLRDLVAERAEVAGLHLAVPAMELCTDNAAMIGAAAQFATPCPWPEFLGLDAMPTAPPGGVAA